MPLIKWTEDYEIGVDVVDEGHRDLVEAINDLYDSIPGQSSANVLAEAMRTVRRLLIEHFVDEEDEMRRRGYPGYASHKKDHDQVVAQVSDLIHEHEENPFSESPEKLTRVLADWFVLHCRYQDKDFKRFAEQAAAAG